MKFIDETRISATAGSGGNGAISWRREAHVAMGGPDGGDGGSGGAVILAASTDVNTLLDFSFNPLLKAENGLPGGPQQQTGRSGKNNVVEVPVGTQVYHEDTLVADLSVDGSRWVAARGGHGGKGNCFFKSATNRAPRFAQSGQVGEQFEFRLVLKSVADVGLLGFPNVGKSTFISRVSSAKPKVADYPFTTLAPSLGVVALDDSRRFVVADIPGLIAGASEGKGLGIRFLRHIERTTVLMQCIDISASDTIVAQNTEDDISNEDIRVAVLEQFESIDQELRNFSDEVAAQPRVIVFSKCDLPLNKRAAELCTEHFEAKGYVVSAISSANGDGIRETLELLYRQIKAASAAP